jgi:phage terminase large subunit GpA-like protein
VATAQQIARRVVAALLAVFNPRCGLEVWEWAERNLNLTHRVTRYPGPLRFDKTPYMTGEWSPLWAYRRYREVDNIWAAQTGKTLMLQVTICYNVAVDPGPGMLVYPDQHTARRRSKKHLIPMIRDNLGEFQSETMDDLNLLEYTMSTCTINLGWAGSPSVLAGEPVKYLWLDEEAKFKEKSKNEADSKRLALRRTISYGDFARVFNTTTPSLEKLPGWRDWEGSTKCQCYVPCPECGHEQVMYFSQDVDRKWFERQSDGQKAWSGGIKWDRNPDLTLEDRIASAYYECEACGAHWDEQQKNAAVAARKWKARNPRAKRYASHLPSWYAPWVKLSEVVERWFDSYRREDARHDFLNSDCAVPYEEAGKQNEESALRKLILPGHHTGMVPPQAVVLILTADVHDDHLRYRIRAHAPDLTSWGVAEGRLMPDLSQLDNLLAKTYPLANGGAAGIGAGLIDARWRTDEVYQFCMRHEGIIYPAMGYDGRIREAIKPVTANVVSDPAQGLYLEGKVTVIDFHDERWKTLLFNRLTLSRGEPGYMYLEEEISEQYLFEMCGEAKVEKPDSRGRVKYEWKQMHDNHALDCEKLQVLAQEVFQLSSLTAVVEESKLAPPANVINPFTGKPLRGG